MDHPQTQADNFFARRTRVRGHFVSSRKFQQIGFTRKVFDVLKIRLQLVALHQAWVAWRQEQNTRGFGLPQSLLLFRQTAKVLEQGNQVLIRKLAQSFADLL